jgi:hypothetical protein
MFTCGCFACVFLLGWSAITLFVNLSVLNAAVHDTPGEFLFLVLFSVPFNTLLLMILTMKVAGVHLRKRALLHFGAGIEVRDDGQQARIRLPQFVPIWNAFMIAFIGPIPLVVLLAMATSCSPPTAVAAGGLALVLACIVAAYTITARANASGRFDLVIDRIQETITLPQESGRREPVVIRWCELLEIRVEAEERKNRDGDSIMTYAVMVYWQRGDADESVDKARLATSITKESAESVVALICRVFDRVGERYALRMRK